MALLVDRKMIGRASSIVHSDLSDKTKEVAAAQRYAAVDDTFDLANARLWLDEFAEVAARGAALRDVIHQDSVLMTSAGSVGIRTYNPDIKNRTIVFVHGGGWAIGSILSHDHFARWLAAEADAQVIQIEYALAPENPYPKGLNQITGVIAHVLQQARGPVMVAGDSAGANLAAMSILALSPAQRQQIACFVSIYGAYAPDMNLSSHRLYGDGRFGLSEAQMRWFWNLYAPHIQPENRAKLLSPLEADLTGFPPTLCIGTECDLLLDDTLAFYSELTRARVDVSLSLWPGLTHGCLAFVGVLDCVDEAANSILQYIETHAAIAPAPRPVPLSPSASAPRNQALPEMSPAPPPLLVDVEPLFLASKPRLQGSLAHRLACQIITGELAPGSLLPREESASEAYGVSRSTYREAIRTLVAKSMVVAQPKVGTKVAPRATWQFLDPDIITWHFEVAPSEGFIRNLFELRKIVEPSAAALAATRRTELELAELADGLSRMARSNPRSGAWLNAAIAFHHGLLTASRNEVLVSMWPAIQTTIRWSVKLQMMLPELSLSSDPVADHARVFEKIAAHDAHATLTDMALLTETAFTDTLSNMKRIVAMNEKIVLVES
ncbi:MAG: alpha/beta hydrolase fold domain-containing protein [Devosia sp.]|nr:alpha/beta hydrolase fold domain-containing protein [Devosia sp.]